MPLNKSTGNMYKFITHTWNTVKGECPHGCSYCYIKHWGKQPLLHFDEKELKTDLGKGNFIFVGSSCDVFAKHIPYEWKIDTLNRCLEFPKKWETPLRQMSGLTTCRGSLILIGISQSSLLWILTYRSLYS